MLSYYQIGYLEGYYGYWPSPDLMWSKDYRKGWYDGEEDWDWAYGW